MSWFDTRVGHFGGFPPPRRWPPIFTRGTIDAAWPGWVRRIDMPPNKPGYAVIRIGWWRWLAWWKVRRFRQWIEAVQPAGVWVEVRP